MSNVEIVALKKLVPDSRNARLHNERNIEEIKKSLHELGQHRPFVVQRETNKVIVGNGMLKAALALGWKEGLVLWVDDDDITATRRAIADNRTAEHATWDERVLQEILSELGNLDVDVPGFSADEVDELVNMAVDGVLPPIVDNSGNEDDRGNRTEPGKRAMVVSIGTMSTLFDYEKTVALCDAIREKFSGEDGAAMLLFCEDLYARYCDPRA